MTNLFALPQIFSNGMIIQHGIETALWGTATAGARVRAVFLGEQRETTVSGAGTWRLQLPAAMAGGPYDLTVRCGDDETVIHDILAGEIWVAGGQSNMEWPLKTTLGYRDHIAAAQYPQIRFFNVPKVLYEGEMTDNPAKFSRAAAWRPATPDYVGEFSAVGYHFAQDLYEHLAVPVGVIECNLGGSSASAWIREDWLTRDADIQTYLDDYKAAVAKLNLDEYWPACKQMLQMMSANPMVQDPEIEIDQPFDFSQLPAEILQPLQFLLQPGPCTPFGHPGSLYASMITTIAPFTAKGVIFYQGESDDVKARIYSKLFGMMIDCWRETFENPDMPFVFVQLAAFGREGNPDGDMYAILRDQQWRVSETISGATAVVAMDAGSFHDIHPRRKQPIGLRLALAARARVYGEPVEYSGPVYRRMQIEGNQIRLEFDHAESGLFCRGESLQGFRIAGANRLYYNADARIDGQTVVLTSEKVSMPAAASFGWANYMAVNLYNGEGLPAVPFKTDRYL